MVLRGRLGLETARVPHADRHGLLWLARGNLTVEDGTLHFTAASSAEMDAGEYQIPFQNVSLILLGPGTTISHDALRLMARHGTGLVAVGEDGVRMYTAPPFGTNESICAHRQVTMWSDAKGKRLHVARRMYGMRLGELLYADDIAVLRRIEGARMKESYTLLAKKYGVEWHGRRYDRQHPESADHPNQALNHSATAVEAAASIAVAATGMIPQLGFIHEDSANAFCLDVADLFRDQVVIPVAFQAVKLLQGEPEVSLDRHVRKLAGRVFHETMLIPRMIDKIKELFDADDSGRDA